MKITTLVENQLALDHRDLEAEFGLSLLIEHTGQRTFMKQLATMPEMVKAYFRHPVAAYAAQGI